MSFFQILEFMFPYLAMMSIVYGVSEHTVMIAYMQVFETIEDDTDIDTADFLIKVTEILEANRNSN